MTCAQRKARTLIDATLGAVLIASVAACSSEELSSGAGGGGPIQPLPPLPSSCTPPERPAPLSRDAVVGDGSPGSCTRAALQEAVLEGGNVRFDCGAAAHTLPIDQEVVIAADTILDGAGTITLDGGDASRLLAVEAHVSLTVVGLTFSHGRATATGGERASGGAIRGGWQGSLSVFDCVFADNVAGSDGEEGGGALYVPSASTMVIAGSTFLRNRGGIGGAVHNLLSGLTIVDSSFVDNESVGGGGAVYTDGASAEIDDQVGGVIDLCGCRFEGNRARQQGGGAYLFAYPPDRFSVNQCLFDGNVVESDAGGGALGGGLRTGNAPLQVAHSLFVDNHSDVHGGGLWVDGDHLSEVINCTFYRNDAGLVGQDGGYGGAISGANLLIVNATLANNHAEHSGGAIFNEDTASVTLRNSIVAFNDAANEWDLDWSCRDTMQGARNLQWPAPSGEDLPCTADPLAADPLVGELSDNGGPTATLPLLPGSPAIDAGQDCPEEDQRGMPRGGACDLGSFELQ